MEAPLENARGPKLATLIKDWAQFSGFITYSGCEGENQAKVEELRPARGWFSLA
jgi:hypothetical protein